MTGFRENDGAVIFNLRVVPNSSRSEIIGEFDGALKIKIAAPPVDGAANAAVIKLLAKKTGVPKSEIKIIGGLTSKNKQVKILTADQSILAKLFGK